MMFLQPVIPKMAEQAQVFLQDFDWSWGPDILKPLLNHKIATYQPLLQRLQFQTWEAMIASGAL